MIHIIRIWSVGKSSSSFSRDIINRRERFQSLFHRFASIVKMEANSEIHLRMNNDKEQFELSFLYHVPSSGISKQMHFTRNLSESVGVFLHRLSMKVNFSLQKKQKKLKKKTAEDENKTATISANFIKDENLVPEDVLCKDLFEGNPNIVLLIGEERYRILKNHPWIKSVALPKSIMAGYPVYPVKLISQYTNEEESDFSWYRMMQKCEEYLSSGVIYTPSVQDIGHKLKLICTPKRNGIVGVPAEIISNNEVEAGPGFCPFETRHAFTKFHLTGDSFRMVSYNILADLYASSETGKNELFTYCPPYALSMDYRKQLITKELLGYNADIISLQEVDCRIFENDLTRTLNNFGFEGEFAKKGGQVNEGIACFYKKSRFKLISHRRLTLGEDSCTLTYLSHIWDAVNKNVALFTKLKERTTAAQILLFDCIEKPGHNLIVANTHLYFHPKADHIRLLQAGICLGYINEILNHVKKENPDCKVSVVFNGDFNSTPECGVYKLFTSGHIAESFHEWKCEEGAEDVMGLSLHNPIPFDSACGTPEFTHYTPNFAGCLDYIFYQCDSLKVEQVIPFPLKEDIMRHLAIPSIVFPSDHIALVADLKWK